METLEADRQRLQRELREAEASLNRHRERLRRMDAAASTRLEQMDELKRELAEARRKLDQLQSSRSWRLTRPIRATGSAIRRLRGAGGADRSP